ncbi:MAG: hypothetical protein MUE68_11875 [Bacteroidetes bacterium]|nr:hypothetical protein [Bacteroidota bacterium]
MRSHARHEGPFCCGRGPWSFIAALVLLTAAPAPAAAQVDGGDDPSSWFGSLSLRAMSRLSQYGIDAAPERITFVAGGRLACEGGFSLGLSAAIQPDPWTAQRTSLMGEYELAVSEAWNLAFSLVRTWYPAGSTNPSASSPTSATIAVAFDGDVWSFGADLDRYFGGEGATYASVDASLFIAGEGFSVLPIVSLSVGSQTVTASSLKRDRGRNAGLVSTTATVTGLSSIDGMVVLIVPLGNGWSVSAMPGLMYSPSDLASSSTRFTWSLGLRRSL